METRFIIAGVQTVTILLIALAWMYAMWPTMTVGISAYVVIGATAYFYRERDPNTQ